MSEATSPAGIYPDIHALTEGLAVIFQVGAGHSVAVVDRRPNPWGGTFPAEIVTCRVDERSDLRVFCKYETGASAGSHGHRGGVAYEWMVYRDLLQPLSLTVPRYYGSYEDEPQGWLWFVLEYLHESLPVHRAHESDAVVQAARWIGDFHALLENDIRHEAPSFLLHYDREYYCGWAERGLQLGRSKAPDSDWLPDVCRRFQDEVDQLLRQPLTVIHGEYYPRNIRCQAGTIRPVDWESAAVGAGEVDLASLTERWPDELARECEQVYGRTRWPEGVPAGFHQRVDLARLYLQFRWLGSLRGWRLQDESSWRITEIRRVAERQGLL